MSKFWGASVIEIKDMISYKFEVFIWGILNPIMLGVYYYLWHSIYTFSGQTSIRGFTFGELISYYALTLIVSVITWTNVDQLLAGKVRDGTLVNNLLRPLHVFTYHLYKKIGGTAFTFVGQALPLVVISILFINLRITSLPNLLLFIISVVLAMLLTFAFSFLVGLSSFWLIKYAGVRMIRSGTVWFLGGNIVPLAFFPEAWQKISNFLPFQYMSYSPIQIFLGRYDLYGSLWVIAAQLIWLVILFVLVFSGWKVALKQFSAVGQ